MEVTSIPCPDLSGPHLESLNSCDSLNYKTIWPTCFATIGSFDMLTQMCPLFVFFEFVCSFSWCLFMKCVDCGIYYTMPRVAHYWAVVWSRHEQTTSCVEASMAAARRRRSSRGRRKVNKAKIFARLTSSHAPNFGLLMEREISFS